MICHFPLFHENWTRFQGLGVDTPLSEHKNVVVLNETNKNVNLSSDKASMNILEAIDCLKQREDLGNYQNFIIGIYCKFELYKVW